MNRTHTLFLLLICLTSSLTAATPAKKGDYSQREYEAARTYLTGLDISNPSKELIEARIREVRRAKGTSPRTAHRGHSSRRDQREKDQDMSALRQISVEHDKKKTPAKAARTEVPAQAATPAVTETVSPQPPAPTSQQRASALGATFANPLHHGLPPSKKEHKRAETTLNQALEAAREKQARDRADQEREKELMERGDKFRKRKLSQKAFEALRENAADEQAHREFVDELYGATAPEVNLESLLQPLSPELLEQENVALKTSLPASSDPDFPDQQGAINPNAAPETLRTAPELARRTNYNKYYYSLAALGGLGGGSVLWYSYQRAKANAGVPLENIKNNFDRWSSQFWRYTNPSLSKRPATNR